MTLYKSKKKLKQTKELHFASCKVVKSNDQRERERSNIWYQAEACLCDKRRKESNAWKEEINHSFVKEG